MNQKNRMIIQININKDEKSQTLASKRLIHLSINIRETYSTARGQLQQFNMPTRKYHWITLIQIRYYLLLSLMVFELGEKAIKEVEQLLKLYLSVQLFLLFHHYFAKGNIGLVVYGMKVYRKYHSFYGSRNHRNMSFCSKSCLNSNES